MTPTTYSMSGFVVDHADIFANKDQTTLHEAWDLYRQYVEDKGLPFTMNKIRFREDLANYFDEFVIRDVVDGMQVRGVYRGFKQEEK